MNGYDKDNVGLESAMPVMPEMICFTDTDKGPSASLWCWRCGRAGAYTYGHHGKWGESMLVRCLYCRFEWTTPSHVADVLRGDFERHRPAGWFHRFTFGKPSAWTRTRWTRWIPLTLLALALLAPVALGALFAEPPSGLQTLGLILFLAICWSEVWRLPRSGG